MAKTNTIARASAPANASTLVTPRAFVFKGRNAVIRNAALSGVASLAYAEGQSRAEMVAQLRIVLGSAPKADEVKAVMVQYVIGRVAQRLASDSAHKGKSVADLITYASQRVLQCAAPVKDGTKANKLRAGQIGRRTPAEHAAIRNAEGAWSLIKAEVAPALSSAKTLAQKNAKRSTNNNPVRGAGKANAPKAGTGLTHSELVKPDGKPHDKASAHGYILDMSRTLLAFSNKHAGVIEAPFGACVKRFHAALAQLVKDADA